jgi:hypothetical protein
VISWWLLLSACNRAPVDYDYDARAPGAQGAWTHPSDAACNKHPDDPAETIDGFAYCQTIPAARKVPFVDPEWETCDDLTVAERSSDDVVLAVSDGVEARAYPLAVLSGRDFVNDWWSGDPILVDY